MSNYSNWGKKKKPTKKNIQEQLGVMDDAIKIQERRLEHLTNESQKCLREAKEAHQKNQKASLPFLFPASIILLD